MLEIEYVRKFVDINMFTDDVASVCRHLGLTNGLNWYTRLQKTKVVPSYIFGLAVRFYQQKYGDQDTWLSPEIQKRMKDKSCERLIG